MFSTKDVADYYDQTQHHYEHWWKLGDHLSLHYGIWLDETKTFAEALANTNQIMADAAKIGAEDLVMDAGCGVGGAAFFLAKTKHARVKGVSLSPKQIALATNRSQDLQLDGRVLFAKMDFTKTSFPDAAFNVVWACESVCHALAKAAFTNEAFRLLKPGGRLVLFDFFKSHDPQDDPQQLVKKWGATWGVQDFSSPQAFHKNLKASGFQNIRSKDYTANVQKSAKRLYTAAIFGAVPAEFYNLFHPHVQRWTKTHYQCGYYQYKALKKRLWKYLLFTAEKPQ